MHAQGLGAEWGVVVREQIEALSQRRTASKGVGRRGKVIIVAGPIFLLFFHVRCLFEACMA